MVELVEQRFERLLDVCVVHDPAELRIERSGDMDLDAERVPMQARALVPGGHVRKPVRRLDLEGFRNLHRGESTGGRPQGAATVVARLAGTCAPSRETGCGRRVRAGSME